MLENPRQLLISLFNTALNAADPRKTLAGFLPDIPHSPAIVIGAGKAAASMAQALESHWKAPLSGLVVVPYGYELPCENIEVVQASHPVPDEMGERVSLRILEKVKNLSAEDLVIVLISGGGSALLTLPAPGITLMDKQKINKALLKCGASISEMNCLRKHLSAIKGGGLAAACAPAQVMTYAISDVPGDKASVIASGPTVADPSTVAEAIGVLEKYKIDVSDGVTNWLYGDSAETLKESNAVFSHCRFQLIATPGLCMMAAKKKAEQYGLSVLYLGDDIEGESRQVAKAQGAIARSIQKNNQPLSPPCLILSGGETTVTVKGEGRGGRNAEFLLSLSNYLQDQQGIYALAADTDGIDGSENNAGALLSPDTWQRALDKKLDAAAMLENNDGYSYFEALGDLLVSGPTLTNVNDFRAILVLPQNG